MGCLLIIILFLVGFRVFAQGLILAGIPYEARDPIIMGLALIVLALIVTSATMALSYKVGEKSTRKE